MPAQHGGEEHRPTCADAVSLPTSHSVMERIEVPDFVLPDLVGARPHFRVFPGQYRDKAVAMQLVLPQC